MNVMPGRSRVGMQPMLGSVSVSLVLDLLHLLIAHLLAFRRKLTMGRESSP